MSELVEHDLFSRVDVQADPDVTLPQRATEPVPTPTRISPARAFEEAYTLDSIAEHVGALRRASQFLYTNGIISVGDHARTMTKLYKYQMRLERASEMAQERMT